MRALRLAKSPGQLSRLATVRRDESGALQHAGTEAGKRAPTLPRVIVVARAPVCRWASLAAQALYNENVSDIVDAGSTRMPFFVFVDSVASVVLKPKMWCVRHGDA